MFMSFRIVEMHTQKVVCDGFTSYTEAWATLEQLPISAELDIEEYKKPVTRLGRDPDLH